MQCRETCHETSDSYSGIKEKWDEIGEDNGEHDIVNKKPSEMKGTENGTESKKNKK